MQVCKAWKEVVEAGLQRLQSDNIWTHKQLAQVHGTFPGLQSLDLQNCGSWYVAPEPLQQMSNLRHLRLCRVQQLPQVSWTQTIAKLKQLQSLCLPS